MSPAFFKSVDTNVGSRFLPSRVWLVRFAIAVGAFVAIIVLAWLAVPWIVRDQIELRLTGALGRKTTVEKVEFDPLTLRLTLRKFLIADPAGAAPLFAVDELVADISSASLWRRAPVLDALKLVRPAVSFARNRDGRYSMQDLIDKAMAAPEGPPPGFSLNNIEIDDGSIAFDDGETGSKHRVEKLALGIPFLSSLKYQSEIRVTPHLEGAFDGSHFALGGTTTPFAENHEAAIDIDIDALPIKSYVAYLPTKPRIDVAGGTLTTRLKVVFVDGKPEERKLELRGDARVDGLALARRDASSLAGANRIAVALDRVDLFGRDIRVASLAVDAAAVDLKRLSDGALELAQPLFESAPVSAGRREGQKPPGATTTPEKPWSVTVAKTTVTQGKVALVDETSTFRSTLVDVAVSATNLSTKKGQKAHVALSFVSDDRIATFKGEADVEPLVPAATGTFELTKFALDLLFPFYKEVLAVDVQKGSLDLAGHFALVSDGNVKISEGVATIRDLTLAYPGNRQPFWLYPNLAAGGIEFDLRDRSVKIADLESHGASMKIARERDGGISVARLMKTTERTGTAARDERTWTLAFGKFVVDRASIDLEDRVPEPAVKLAIRDLAFTTVSYSNARGAKSTTTVRARVGDRGRLLWSGALATNPVSFSGQLDVSGLDLVTVRPYIESHANVSLTAGALAAKGAVAVDVPESAPVKAGWKGDVVVTDFAALDKPTASDLLRWKRLALDSVDVATGPFRLSVGRVGAEDYFARAIVYSDGTLNLTRLLTPGKEPEPAPDAKPAPAPAAPGEREALPVTIGKIELARGNVNFSDFFVRPNYSANLTDVTGTVTTMSADQAGDIAISAQVERTAPVEVSGRIHPFAKDLALDIRAKARDVDLPPLTPYSAKYAGYGIEKGKLTFDVHYRVENRKLAAENRLVLDQLTFNPQHIDSPTATKLPVLLAVALLKDTNGVIDIQLPIAGSLDDPKFSVGGLIIQVIINLLEKAVTAPFALLGAAFGHGEELSTIPFAPGSAVPDAEAQKRLEALSKALADRPALKLDIGGRADSGADREALRHASVESAMKREKMKSLAAAGSAPASVEQVTVGAEERVRWLTAAYRESSIKDRPRNVIGLLKELPPEEMEAILLADVKIDDDALRLLANARAQAVKDDLAARDVAGERLFLTVPRLSSERAAQAAEGARAGGATPAAAAPERGTAADSVSSSRVDLALR
jgi:uncharacterized protein involved in outer membrane biogenesis